MVRGSIAIPRGELRWALFPVRADPGWAGASTRPDSRRRASAGISWAATVLNEPMKARLRVERLGNRLIDGVLSVVVSEERAAQAAEPPDRRSAGFASLVADPRIAPPPARRARHEAVQGLGGTPPWTAKPPSRQDQAKPPGAQPTDLDPPRPAR